MSPRSPLLVVALWLLPIAVFAADPAPPEAAAAAPADETAPAAEAAPAAAADAVERETAATDAAAGSETLVVTDREAEYARIAPRLAAADELQWLEAEGKKFVALIRKPRQGPPRGALLIVPAPQELVDRREVIHSLRTLPPAGGFVTLALQPPLGVVPAAAEAAAETAEAAAETAEAAAETAEAAAETADTAADAAAPEADGGVDEGADSAAAQADAAEKHAPSPVHPDFCPRLAAALAALQATLARPPAGAEPPLLAIAASDASVPAVLGCYADGLPDGLRAFAALGRWSGDFGALAVPSVEFVPLRDPAAVAAADARARLPLADDAPPRRRVDIDGVDGRLDGAGEDIAKRLRGWLEHLPPPAAIAPAAPGLSS